MKFGVREICDVVLKARAPMKVGNKVFYANEPVLYFDTLKTSSLEGASTTVYAQGGRGNARLVAWDGDRTLTFTMEDALISAEGFMILAGAGLIDASKQNTIKQHVTEKTTAVALSEDKKSVQIFVKNLPYEQVDTTTGAHKGEFYIYAMRVDNDEPVTEPYLPTVIRQTEAPTKPQKFYFDETEMKYKTCTDEEADTKAKAGTQIYYGLQIKEITSTYKIVDETEAGAEHKLELFEGSVVLLDYYIEKASKTRQIEITADSFGGNFYLEASTLFRTQDGVDLPAEFVIPNCKIQSNFTFSMAATGDPATFTFTLDAFPGTTRFNPTKKVLAAIQIIEDIDNDSVYRTQTIHDPMHDSYFDI